MDKVISTLATMPAFIAELFEEHLVLTILGIMIFLLALMVPGRIGSLIRKIVILANVMFAMAGGFMGRGQNGYEIICLSAISLLLLFIIRTIVRIVGALKQRRIDARIEKRALAKAAKRRSTLSKPQSQDNGTNDQEDDFVPPELSQVEIRQVIENEINEGKARNEAVLASHMESTFSKEDDEMIIPEFDQAFSAEERQDSYCCSFYTQPGRFFYQTSGENPEADFRTALRSISELRRKGIISDDEYLIEKEKLDQIIKKELP